MMNGQNNMLFIGGEHEWRTLPYFSFVESLIDIPRYF